MKLEKVKTWIAVDDNVESISPNKLILLLHELSVSDNIGLQGGKFFTITYRWIASVFHDYIKIEIYVYYINTL